MRLRTNYILFALITGAPGIFPDAKQAGDYRDAILNQMKIELNRSKKDLKLKGHDSPYFIGYRWTTSWTDNIVFSDGALSHESFGARSAFATVEVRVGDYQFDNTAVLPRRLGEWDAFERLARSVPYEDEASSIRKTFWRLTDDAYKRALEAYYNKKAKLVVASKEKISASFSREVPNKYRSPIVENKTATSGLTSQLRPIATRLAGGRHINHSNVSLHVNRGDRVLISTEGTEIVESEISFDLHISGEAISDDGMIVDLSRSFHGRSLSDFPTHKALSLAVDELMQKLAELRQAPAMDPYAGPALLMPQAAGVLFHEAIGHRLEGHRQENEEEGRTFQNHLGKRVMPDFLHLSDDPTLKEHEGVPLSGHYQFDEEGVKSQNVKLVENGILKNFLMSRQPTKNQHKSNGHGRGNFRRRVVGRMGVTILNSDKRVPLSEMKKLLIAEVKKQGKPFGIIFTRMLGGYTMTRSYEFQAFKATPYLVYKVYPDGREELVRGVELVGTPLTAINKIIMASYETEVFNGVCGAESGHVPVSNISPAVLTTEIELQRAEHERESRPILTPP